MNNDRHSENHSHGSHTRHHNHHMVSADLLASSEALSVVHWSAVALLGTAGLQLFIVWISHSSSLLADTIHNFGDAATAIPLGIAFSMGRWAPTKRFTYGFGRAEDLAGFAVVLLIMASAIGAAWTSVERWIHPIPVVHVGAVAAASIIGFLGNEMVALWRIKKGKEIGSAALVADGQHARIDGLTSLAVLLGVFGVLLGHPRADALVGGLIALMIAALAVESVKTLFERFMDAIDPAIVEGIRHSLNHSAQVLGVSEIRVRWIGHRLHAEVNITLRPDETVEEAHKAALNARNDLLHEFPHLDHVVIHVDPSTASGDKHHRRTSQEHKAQVWHSHSTS